MNCIYLKLTDTNWTAIDQLLLSYTSENRAENVLAYKFDKDKKLALYADLLAQMYLSILTGKPTKAIQVKYQKNRKPSSNSGLDFSFAHSEDSILLSIVQKGVTGADLELVANPPFEVMDMVFSKNECAYIDTAKEGAYDRFFEMWTRKEAYTKALGYGLITDLTSISTADTKLSDSLFTWRESAYLCSVYSSDDKKFNKIISKESEVIKFFLE